VHYKAISFSLLCHRYSFHCHS